MKKLKKNYREPEYEEVIEFSQEDEFSIGQCYSKVPDAKLVCKKCKGDRWIVGQGEYHTSIKCPNCLYEITIASG
jgi:hypothetical protein